MLLKFIAAVVEIYCCLRSAAATVVCYLYSTVVREVIAVVCYL